MNFIEKIFDLISQEISIVENNLFIGDVKPIDLNSIKNDEDLVISKLKNTVYERYYSIKKEISNPDTSLEYYQAINYILENNHYCSLGWEVVKQYDENHFYIKKNRVTLLAEKKVLEAIKDENNKRSTLIKVKLPCYQPNKSFGFHSFYSQTGELNFGIKISRIYFNLKPKYCHRFINLLFKKLDSHNVIFQFKVLKNLPEIQRCDSGVLYIYKHQLDFVNKIIKEDIIKNLQLGKYLNPIISVFHKKLFPGIGYADQPKELTESFGMNRSKIVAKIIYETLLKNSNSWIDCENIFKKTAIFVFKMNNIDQNLIYKEE